ncbi:MAG: pyridoxal phosphate-dependent aminotransferase [candidate division Zixibacteria bacterium]|nr:pyridoxal phosphate-dependent aminotransferase [candidate division Zixibacteria bacterium]
MIDKMTKSPKPSGTMSLYAEVARLKAGGADIISFAVGELDINSPESAKRAGIKAIDDNFTRYTVSDGIAELRQAIAQSLSAETGQNFAMEQVIISNGSKQASFNLLAAVLNRGDEVIIPSPYFPSHLRQVELLGATPRLLETSLAGGFQIKAELLKNLITDKTKVLLINSPHNPTGAVYTKETLTGIAEVVKENNILLLLDEIYSGLVFPPAEEYSMLKLFPELKNNFLIAGGFSKAFAMTGWRVGFAAGPLEIIEAAGIIQSNTTTNVCSISQKAALAAMQQDPDFVKKLLPDLISKRDTAVELLNSINGLDCLVAGGAFYLFPSVKKFIGKTYDGHKVETSQDIASYLLRKHGLAVVPGESFGAPGFIRLNFSICQTDLQKGLKRLKDGLEQLQ